MPTFQPSPLAPPSTFGAHNNWSIGPTLSFTLWDQGALYKVWKSQKARARSGDAAALLAERQARLGVRLAYFQLQLAFENTRLLGESLALAESQYADIDRRLKAGAASKVDDLSAHQQVLDYKKSLRQSQADLTGALRELFAITGASAPADLSLYVSTSSLALDPIDQRAAGLEAAAARTLDPAHPRLRLYAEQADASRLAASALKSAECPRVVGSARASYDYPNVPLIERVQQNVLSLSATVPLFEARKTARDIDEQRRLSAAAEDNARQAADELARDFGRARDEVAALRDQQSLDRESVRETGDIAALTYSAYAAGSRTYLEVESANLRALAARAAAARTQAQTSIQLAVLDSMAAKANP